MAEVDASAIAEGLLRLEIRQGDTLLIHSSLSSFGPVAGGAEAVIDALLRSVGEEGTVVFPTFTNSFPGQNPPYHPLRTRSLVGIIPEFARFREGAIRSRHPSHSMVALGPKAQEITGRHQPSDSPCGPTSPFRVLYELDGRIVFLGCGLTPNTSLHAVEDWCCLPYLTDRTTQAVLVDMDNNQARISFPNEPGGHRGFYVDDPKIEKAFRREGILCETQIGRASAQRIGMRDLVRVTVNALTDAPDILLCDIPDCAFCQPAKARLVTEMDSVVRSIDALKRELGI